MNKILFKYIFKMQLRTTIFVSFFVFFLILLFDFAEMTRKYPILNMAETIFVIKMSLLRTPSTFCEVLHHVYFIVATFSLWNLNQSHQITILKSAGQSPRQILRPFIGFALLVATTWLFVIHPIGAHLELLYNKNVSTSNFTGINHDIWIDCPKNDKVIFIKNIYDDKIEGLSVFNVKNGQRIFAKQAQMKESFWILENVILIDEDKIKNIETMKIFSMLSTDLIKLLSKTPGKQDIYLLYKVYQIQKNDDVTIKSYELELHKLLANCYSFILFALIAATICLPINRYKTKTSIAIKVISSSVFLRFTNGMLESLAHGGTIPVQFACWAVLLILTCITVAMLIWKEV